MITIIAQSQQVHAVENLILNLGVRVPRACRSLDHLDLANYCTNTSLLQAPKVAHLALVRVEHIDYHRTRASDNSQCDNASTQVAISVSPSKGVVIQ